MTTSVGTRRIGATSRAGRPNQASPVLVFRRRLDLRDWRFRRVGRRMRPVTSMALRSLVLIAVALLLILVLLPAALGAQLAIAD